MVRHHDIKINPCVKEMSRDGFPAVSHDPSHKRQDDSLILYPAEETTAIGTTNRHEIRPRLGVVVAGKADGPALRPHGCPPEIGGCRSSENPTVSANCRNAAVG